MTEKINLEDTLERAQRVMAKVAADMSIMLVQRRISKSRCRNMVLLLEGVCQDIRRLVPGDRDESDGHG